MKTIHKLVLKAYLGPMVLTFFIVMFVLMMNFIWRYIDELVGKGLDAGVIIELMSYAIDLRSMTQSRGSFVMHFVRYEQCSADAQAKAVAAAKAMQEAE